MALSENGSDMVMPVGPMYGNGSGGFGNWNDGSFCPGTPSHFIFRGVYYVLSK